LIWFCIDKNFCLEFGCLFPSKGKERGLLLLAAFGDDYDSTSCFKVSAAGACFSLGVRASAGESKVCIPDFIFAISRGV
jgi:hypothetical protein